MPSKKPQATAAPPAVSPFALLADELGALEKEMAPHAQKLARIEQVRKALRVACPVAPWEQWVVDGRKFQAVLGPCGNERVINFAGLVKTISAAAFAKFAKCSLKDLEANVSPAIVANVVSTEATGSRSLKTFEKGAVGAS